MPNAMVPTPCPAHGAKPCIVTRPLVDNRPGPQWHLDALHVMHDEPLFSACAIIARVQVDRQTQIPPQPQGYRWQAPPHPQWELPHIETRMFGAMHRPVNISTGNNSIAPRA